MLAVWLAGNAVCCPRPTYAQPAEAADEGERVESREEAETEEDELETDRDSFTPATTVVGWRRTMVETSYSFLDNQSWPETHSYPELLTRFGVSENIELRLGWNTEVGGGGAVSGSDLPAEDPSGGGIETETNLLYGFKAFLNRQHSWTPQSSLIVQANTPTSGPDTATQFSAGYVCGWKLPSRSVLDAALRYSYTAERGDHFNLWAPSVVCKVPLSEQWNAHLEYFGIFSQHRERETVSQYVSPGIHYLVTRNLEVGLRVGWGLGDDAAKFFSNVGAGVRF